jgi:peptidyl-prolyl cis-trans isomerase SurA
MKLTALLCAAALGCCALPATAATNRVVAAVYGRPITSAQVEDLLRARSVELIGRVSSQAEFLKEREKLRGEVLESLIDQELILKEYEPFGAGGFDSKVDAHAKERIRKILSTAFKGDEKKMRSELANQGLSYNKFFEQQRKNVIVEMMRGQFAKSDSLYVTEQEKTSYINRHAERFRDGDKLKLWSITIPAREPGKTPADQLALAKEIRTSLVNGADFASLARTHSADSVRENGGYRGEMDKKQLGDEIWNIVSRTPAGKISEVTPLPPAAYCIFWVQARIPGKMQPRGEIDKVVEGLVIAEKRQKASQEWVKKLRKKAIIEYK